MNDRLREIVTEYATQLQSKARLEHDITKAQEELKLVETVIFRLAQNARSVASANPTYIDIGGDRLVVVSSSILEICPLHKAGEKR